MDVSSLRWFQQVADGITVTEVSDLEQVSQSGVSRALARLESEVGVPLFRRSGRVLRMTQAGATFKRHVDRALHELDDGIAALTALADPATGTVVVAFQATLGSWLVPELVAGFRADHPGVRFVLHQVRDELRGPTLLDGTADLEITTVPAQDPTVRWRPLLGQALRLAVPSGSRAWAGAAGRGSPRSRTSRSSCSRPRSRSAGRPSSSVPGPASPHGWRSRATTS